MLNDRVLVQPAPAEDKTANGIIIPDTAKFLIQLKPQRGKVIAAGPGKKDEPMTVKTGDPVLYGKYKYSGTVITRSAASIASTFDRRDRKSNGARSSKMLHFIEPKVLSYPTRAKRRQENCSSCLSYKASQTLCKKRRVQADEATLTPV